MPGQDEGVTSKKGLAKELAPLLLSVTALALSGYSIYTSERTNRDVAGVNAIKNEYEQFNSMARTQMERPLMSHLFSVSGADYDSRSAQVATASASLDGQTKAKLLLEERATAHFIFTMFEETYYNWKQAERVGDKGRAKLLLEDVRYFNQALCNPRLLWYWDTDNGAKLGWLFAGELQEHYRNEILKTCEEENDPNGPFSQPVTESKKPASLGKNVK